jgi:hypothetical protein
VCWYEECLWYAGGVVVGGSVVRLLQVRVSRPGNGVKKGLLRLNEQLCLGNKLREGSRYCSCQTKDGITGYGRTEYLKRHED